MDKFKKMTKEELVDEVNKLNKELVRYKELDCEFNLLKFLYQDYVLVIEESRRINKDLKVMEQRIIDLQDLCDRQQRIIDSER